jgi:hypothetical protein
LRVVIIVALMRSSSESKLFSTSFEIDRAKEEIEEVLEENHLAEGEQYWGPEYKGEIEQTKQKISKNFYQIFADLEIQEPIARCIVYGQKKNDPYTWLERIEEFNEAIQPLNQKDKAQYFFALGFVKVQFFPETVTDFPEEFGLAARNGYPSSLVVDYFARKGEQYDQSVSSEKRQDIFSALAESYQRGGFFKEAYKLYLLASQTARVEPEFLTSMVACAYNDVEEVLAYRTALLFLETFSFYHYGETPNGSLINALEIKLGEGADSFWGYISGGALAFLDTSFSKVPPPKNGIHQRKLKRFDRRYIHPIVQNLGAKEDLFYIRIFQKYWADSTIIMTYIPAVRGGIDEYDGAIEHLAKRIRHDSRLADNAEIARWEMQRWKKADKLDEFIEKFPERHTLAQKE